MMGPLSIYVRLQGGVLGRFQGSSGVRRRFWRGSKQVRSRFQRFRAQFQ